MALGFHSDEGITPMTAHANHTLHAAHFVARAGSRVWSWTPAFAGGVRGGMPASIRGIAIPK
jgi:hypothetical protein